MRVYDLQFNVPSNDPKASLRFYVDGLLFTEVSYHPKISLGTVAFGDFKISFVQAEDASLITKPNSRYTLFSIRLEGIQDYYNRVRAIGMAQIERELDYYPGQTWQFTVVDNNGYRIAFNQKDSVA
jgi:predicted enzyme related to lactoylglutathione lyase